MYREKSAWGPPLPPTQGESNMYNKVLLLSTTEIITVSLADPFFASSLVLTSSSTRALDQRWLIPMHTHVLFKDDCQHASYGHHTELPLTATQICINIHLHQCNT